MHPVDTDHCSDDGIVKLGFCFGRQVVLSGSDGFDSGEGGRGRTGGQGFLAIGGALETDSADKPDNNKATEEIDETRCPGVGFWRQTKTAEIDRSTSRSGERTLRGARPVPKTKPKA